jgi:hypothetical protein
MLRLVNRILDLTKVRSVTEKPQPAACYVCDIVDETARK